MKDLLAYIPVLNRQYLDWLLRHRGSHLHLISQQLAESLLPRLKRNMIALDTKFVADLIVSQNLASRVTLLTERDVEPRGLSFVAPQEDVTEAYAFKYLQPYQHISYEMIWARWDMSAVKRARPVIPDCIVSLDEVDIFRIKAAERLSKQSPDWWLQIGAMIFRGDELIVCGWNSHLPTDYEAFVFGDTRLNFDAGDPAGMDAYLSLHAEEYCVTRCAQNGIPLEGTSMYINIFPCGRCARVIALSGIKRLYFREGSAFLKGFEILQGYGIEIIQVKHPAPA